MIVIDGVFLPDEIFSLQFGCQYQLCRSACCVVGDQGAPIEIAEVNRITEYFSDIQSQLDPEAKKHIGLFNFYVNDPAGYSTACIGHTDRCVFSALNPSGDVSCLLETVSVNLNIPTLRPVSCRLFPLRIRSLNTLQIVDYERWNECRESWNQGPYIIDFCKNALIDRFGKNWFRKCYDYFLRFRNDIG